MELRVKEICKEKGLLFKDLAAKVGVHDVTLRASLQGNPTIGTLEKIAVALGVDLTELFVKQGDFVAFVRRNGTTHTFESEQALKEFVDTFSASTE